MNGFVNNVAVFKKDWEIPQFPESMQDLSPEEQFDIMRVFNKFKHENLSDEVAASLTVAFYNDPVYVRIRDKIKSASEDTIDSFKRKDITNA